MRYLAIDYGDRFTGLAICDAAEIIASPLTVVDGQKHLLGQITDIVRSENVEAVVLGLALNMDGTEGPRAECIRRFAGKLKKHLDIPVHFQDERLSSFGAREKLAALNFAKRKKNRRIDAVAAAEILQAFLEQKADNTPISKRTGDGGDKCDKNQQE